MCKNKIVDTLVVIPARGGSKGLPGKNIKELNGKPLIHYTIEAAREVFPDEHICVSTDDPRIVEVVEETGLKVMFLRPPELASDTAGSWDVVKHAYDFYSSSGRCFCKVALLQPTSPLRTGKHIRDAFNLFLENKEAKMVVSVMETKANPYFNLFELDRNGFMVKSKKADYLTRQACPRVYELNGAIYILNAEEIVKGLNLAKINVVPYLMSRKDSIDIDDSIDFKLAELLI